MSIYVANEDMVLAPNNPAVVATITRTGLYSVSSKAVGKKVTPDGFTVSVTNITVPSAGATIPDPGPYVVPLNATAQKTKTKTKLVCREGDLSDSINATPKILGIPPVDYPVSFKIVIQSAGQIKVKAN